MLYSYKGIHENRSVEGVIEASDIKDAVRRLKEQGITPVRVKESVSKKVKKDAQFLERFTTNLLQLLRAGLTLDKAVLFVARKEKKYYTELNKIYEEIRGGNPLSTALKLSGLFPESYVSMIRAAEESGHLEETLHLIGDFLREENELRKNLITAMIYPSFIFGVGILSFLVISSYVVPKFKVVFQSIDIELPLITRVMFAVTDVLNYVVVGFIVAFLILLLAVRVSMRDEAKRLKLEGFLFRVPVAGRFLLEVEIIRIFQTLYTLVKGGIPINTAFELIKEIPSTLLMRKSVENVKTELIRGGSMTRALQKQGVFPDLVVEIAGVGEQTGELGGAFYQIYTSYNERFKQDVKRFLNLLEPVVILFMGALVGFIVFSMILAVYSISETL